MLDAATEKREREGGGLELDISASSVDAECTPVVPVPLFLILRKKQKFNLYGIICGLFFALSSSTDPDLILNQ